MVGAGGRRDALLDVAELHACLRACRIEALEFPADAPLGNAEPEIRGPARDDKRPADADAR